MKNILSEVISKLKVKKDGYRRIPHKKGWMGFLDDGDLVFKPSELHQILRQVITEFPPNGDKLLYQRKRCNFTVTVEKKPYRPEEALERFITASNPNKFFNQIPIGGKKESIDIGIEENESRFVFIELKPWSSTSSPLYAVVESLKNLIEYRIIHENKIKHHEDCKHYKEVDLIILAPEFYYQFYGLIDERTGRKIEDKISIVKKALNEFCSEFKTNISLMILPIEEGIFLNKCRRICEEQNVDEQQSITISESNAISELTREKWKLLVSSDGK